MLLPAPGRLSTITCCLSRSELAQEGATLRSLMALGRLSDDQILRIKRTLTLISASDDPELWKLARESKVHISDRAVVEEYDRLVLKKIRA